ncbi:DUF1414 domain-containing protein [Catenovulum sediminis]|uniref:DUF1414 domain-containing protein n=1 Tax=Catenovulum sediminis TaxID=1740262 RepID=A0ABV1RKY2_9ALTE|nr:DUF1414 domain-containing protein [Catenovulum sediminis]
MVQTSKYSDEQLNQAITALKVALESQKLPKDLTLMALGMTTADVIKHNFAPETQSKVAENFAKALKDSVKG